MYVTLDTFWNITDAEREILEPKPRLTLPEWAEAKLTIPSTESAVGGPFSFDYSPYLRLPAEDLSDYHTREVWVQAPTQSAKSLLAFLFMGYTIDVLHNHLMLCMPDEKTVRRRMKGRMGRLLEANDFLLDYIGGDIANLNIGEVNVLEAMNLYIAWAHSAAAISDVPVPYIIADEVGIFPPTVGKGVDPVNMLRDRQKTFPLISKLLGSSSPELVGDLFDCECKQGLVHIGYLLCPFCDRYFAPTTLDMILAKDTKKEFYDPADYENDTEGRLSWFRCPLCEKRWNDRERAYATIHGRWVPKGSEIDSRGEIAGEVPAATRKTYEISTFMVHPAFNPIWRVAAHWVKANLAKRQGNLIPLQYFRNRIEGQPWQVKDRVTVPNLLTERMEDWASGRVPEKVQFATAGLDVQLDHVWCSVNGWAYMAESWLIWAGRIETGDTQHLDEAEMLFDFLDRTWPSSREGGREHRIYLTAIDCAYNHEAVLDFVRACWSKKIQIVPVMGNVHVTNRTYRIVNDKERQITRYDLNVDAIKDRVFRFYFESKEPGPSYAHLPMDLPPEFLDHMTAEDREFVPKGNRMVSTWRIKTGRPANHLLDCNVYSTAAAEISGLWQLPPEPPKVPPNVGVTTNQTNQSNDGFLDDLPKL